MPDNTHIWSQVRRRLQSRVSPDEFHTWFGPLELTDLHGGAAIISVPNRFFSSWLEERYLSDIEDCFTKVVRRSLKIRFRYSECPGGIQSPDLPIAHGNAIDPSMTFESFYTGEWNRFAYHSAQAMAKEEVNPYNPLYIYSGRGLGKTHLLHAIGNAILSTRPDSAVRYVSSATFTADFTRCWKNDQLQTFNDQHSRLNAILFDDVHLLVRRPKTQHAFLLVFDAIYQRKGKIIVSGNTAPQGLHMVSEPLRSRLAWGVLAPIHPPDQGALLEAARTRVREQCFQIPDDVLFFLTSVSSHMKAIWKNIMILQSYVSLKGGDIHLSMAKSLIKGGQKKKVDIEDIKNITAGYFNISLYDLTSAKKKRSHAYPRQVAMYLARRLTDLSLKQIGSHFGQKDHSTVIYSIRKIEQQSKGRGSMRDDLSKIENLLT